MPHMVEYKVSAENVRKGDKLHWRNREWTVEGFPVTKVKYTTVKTEESLEPFRLERWQHVTVLREEPTPEEKFLAYQKRVADNIKQMMANSETRMSTAKEDFKQYIDGKFGKYLIEDHHISTLLEAQTEYVIWTRMFGMLGNYDPDAGKDHDRILERADDEDVIETLRGYVQAIRDDVWGRSGRYSDPFAQGVRENSWDVQKRWVDRYTSVLERLDGQRSEIASK